MKIKIDNKKGILFWITGLSGSGKTTIGRKLKSNIVSRYGPTIIISDNLRKIFHLNKFDKKNRLIIGKKYIRLCKYLTEQGINVIFFFFFLFSELRAYNKKNIKNYVEIYIECEIDKLKKVSKKKHYKTKSKNIWGIDLKPEFPKNPHIQVKNDLKKNIDLIKKEIIIKLDLIIKK